MYIINFKLIYILHNRSFLCRNIYKFRAYFLIALKKLVFTTILIDLIFKICWFMFCFTMYSSSLYGVKNFKFQIDICIDLKKVKLYNFLF